MLGIYCLLLLFLFTPMCNVVCSAHGARFLLVSNHEFFLLVVQRPLLSVIIEGRIKTAMFFRCTLWAITVSHSAERAMAFVVVMFLGGVGNLSISLLDNQKISHHVG